MFGVSTKVQRGSRAPFYLDSLACPKLSQVQLTVLTLLLRHSTLVAVSYKYLGCRRRIVFCLFCLPVIQAYGSLALEDNFETDEEAGMDRCSFFRLGLDWSWDASSWFLSPTTLPWRRVGCMTANSLLRVRFVCAVNTTEARFFKHPGHELSANFTSKVCP